MGLFLALEAAEERDGRISRLWSSVARFFMVILDDVCPPKRLDRQKIVVWELDVRHMRGRRPLLSCLMISVDETRPPDVWPRRVFDSPGVSEEKT